MPTTFGFGLEKSGVRERSGSPALAAGTTLLFAPADDDHKLGGALASDAAIVTFDLEDAVESAARPRAREIALEVLASADRDRPGPALALRVNAAEPDLALDLEVACAGGFDAVVLPKASVRLLEGLPAGLPPVIAMIETAEGLSSVAEICGAPAVAALMLGPEDLSVELSLRRGADGRELLFARSALVLASATVGLRPPIDGPFLDFRDDRALASEAAAARALGFGGKACIHPRQLPIVDRAFTPDDDEIAWARSVLDVYEEAKQEGRGAAAIEGKMVDRPVAERARQLLERAGGSTS